VSARIAFAAALLALIPALAAADQVYKWTDDQGHVHFSQTPPPSTKAQQVTVNVPPPDPQSLQNQQQLQQAMADKDKAAKDAAAKEKKDPKAEALKQQHCDDLRVRLQTLVQAGRATTTDAQGNVNYLDDDARKAQEDDINKELASDCKGH
jgi:hypothetical protein